MIKFSNIGFVDAEINRHDMHIAIVMEAGDTDLAKVLSARQTTADVAPMSPFYVRVIWQEMLEAVDHIHCHRIVHGTCVILFLFVELLTFSFVRVGDLKPANFVFVKGHLKMIDFGIAKSFSNDTTNIYRESQIGTVSLHCNFISLVIELARLTIWPLSQLFLFALLMATIQL